jgi:hypothetical protein
MNNLTQEALSNPRFDALTIKFREETSRDLTEYAAILLETILNAGIK